MALWITLSTLFAWISGALFAAGVIGRRVRSRAWDSPRPTSAYPGGAVGYGWTRSPRLLIQVGLLIAFVGAALVLIVLSL